MCNARYVPIYLYIYTCVLNNFLCVVFNYGDEKVNEGSGRAVTQPSVYSLIRLYDVNVY